MHDASLIVTMQSSERTQYLEHLGSTKSQNSQHEPVFVRT
jgi:hypothetical protein